MLAQTNGDCNVMLAVVCTFISNLVQDQLRPSRQYAPGHVCQIFSPCSFIRLYLIFRVNNSFCIDGLLKPICLCTSSV